MKNLLKIVGLISLAWLIYALFQPIIEWNLGWSQIPENRNEVAFEGISDSEFFKSINLSKQHLDSILLLSESPSISIAAMVQGRMIWTYAIGFRDLEKKLPADTTTRYRIGSVSKALTSLGLAKMYEHDLIQPDSSIQHYTSQFSDKPRISIRQLASHQSGLRNYGACFCFPIWEYYRNKEFSSINQSVSDFESDELLFNPGESFAYSSFNYTALSLAMEKASDRNFLSYMGEYVFSPLGMLNTSADKDRNRSNAAIPYNVNNREFKKSFTVNLSNKWAAGGFISTPSDLVRAGNALLNTTLLDPETIELIITPQTLNDGTVNEQNYGIGWRHDYSDRYLNGTKKVEVIHHGGMAIGGLALLAVYPEYELVIAITLNKGESVGNFNLFDYITPVANAFITK